MSPRKKTTKPKILETPQAYKHSESESLMRPDVGTQPQFPKKKRKAPKEYRYDSSLSPALDWDENPAREQAEALIAAILEAKSLEEAKAAASKLKAMGQPFLNWTGKAEHQSLEVPTLPLFIHERLSTQAIIETLKGHKRGGDQLNLFDLFSDPQHSIVDQTLRAYEHRNAWVNRMILGDSLVVMNSLLEYEGLGGQVQMIYMDPPYGVKFGSNFQPFVRKRDVKHNEDDDFTREPEMVQAYRDTWELGLHSYLSYLRDRLLLARELLTESGSVFVQIGEENVHHVRELMDEVFGGENFVNLITFVKTSPLGTDKLPSVCDYILWFSKNCSSVKFYQIFTLKNPGEAGASRYTGIELEDGTRVSPSEYNGSFENVKLFTDSDMSAMFTTPHLALPFKFKDKNFTPSQGRQWQTTQDGLQKLAQSNRLIIQGKNLRYIRYLNDFPVNPLINVWTDIGGIQSRTDSKIYVVQTSTTAIQRCILMTTDPGDLVLDLTCGSGTTAYVAEQWGRRWITCDVSRVPLALARQRLLTATFPYYELKDESRGPAGGFVYRRKQNKKGEEVGGIVPHITLKSIANDEPPDQEVLVDRPEEISAYTRVAGPFTVEATIPVTLDPEGADSEEVAPEQEATMDFHDRLLAVLQKSPVIRLEGNRTVTFQQVRRPAKTLNLSAEAMIKASEREGASLVDVVDEAIEENAGMLPLSQQWVAIVFGSENGAISEQLVYCSAQEAAAKHYTHLYVIGFAIHTNARQLVEHCDQMLGIPATYIQATPDLLMGDLLKNMRSSQIFSVCGLPDITIHAVKEGRYQVELLGLDVFDPATMENDHRKGNDVPAWFLDTDYNGLCFHVCQAFFPRTSAWDSIKKALKGSYDDAVWDHLSGTTSAPFEPGEHQKIAVKVIDDRGNELLVVREIKA